MPSPIDRQNLNRLKDYSFNSAEPPATDDITAASRLTQIRLKTTEQSAHRSLADVVGPSGHESQQRGLYRNARK